MNYTIFKMRWRYLKRFNGREQLQRVLADNHENVRKVAEEALQMLSKKMERSLRSLHVNGPRKSHLDIFFIVHFLNCIVPLTYEMLRSIKHGCREERH